MPYTPVGQTFVFQNDKNLVTYTSTAFEMNLKGDKKPDLDFHPEEYRQNKWCHDTPGTICDDQIINMLTQDEILKVLPALPIIPRSLNLKRGFSLLIGMYSLYVPYVLSLQCYVITKN